MRYAQIRRMDISNGEGIGVALYTSGCKFHCKNCFNEELWSMKAGTPWNKKKNVQEILDLSAPSYISRLSILGGEPLLPRNISALTHLCKTFKENYPDKKIWLYSGYCWEEIIKKHKKLMEYIDVVVDGLYIHKLRDMTLKYRGSSNQRVIDVQASLNSNEVILADC